MLNIKSENALGTNDDLELSQKDQMPSLVAHQKGTLPDGRLHTIVEAASDIFRVNNENCKRGK